MNKLIPIYHTLEVTVQNDTLFTGKWGNNDMFKLSSQTRILS